MRSPTGTGASHKKMKGQRYYLSEAEKIKEAVAKVLTLPTHPTHRPYAYAQRRDTRALAKKAAKRKFATAETEDEDLGDGYRARASRPGGVEVCALRERLQVYYSDEEVIQALPPCPGMGHRGLEGVRRDEGVVRRIDAALEAVREADEEADYWARMHLHLVPCRPPTKRERERKQATGSFYDSKRLGRDGA
jgi:hypothetical protein